MNEWKTVESTEKPELVDETSSPNVTYERKEIEKIEREEGTIYTYQEWQFTKAEYEKIKLNITITELQEAVENIIPLIL